MKILCLFLIVLPLSCWCFAVEKEFKIESSDDIHGGDATISKRSGGSFDFVKQFKSGILASAGKASASIASGSSSSSSSGGSKHEESSHANSVEYDPWSLKKSVLNTIFQAVKAITGGVTALKGQLIKGSGYALSAGGSLIAASGDKITDVGKGIVNSAQLVPISSGGGSHGGSGIGKFASLSSLSQSSSGSSGHVANEPSGHGASLTSYEIPSGHESYGPPSKTPSHYSSTSQQYLPPGTYTSGLHFSGPASYESSPQLSYLPVEAQYSRPHAYHANHHHHPYNNNYQHHPKLNHDEIEEFEHNAYMEDNFYEILNQRHPSTSNSGPPGFTTHISDRDTHSASVALKEIIHLIPRHETAKLTKTTYLPAAQNKHQQVQQYAIPHDPQYKTVKVGPISSISHMESITTSFGAPLHNFQKHVSTHQIPQNSIDHRPQYHPYDAYHTMNLKYGNKRNQPNSIPTPVKTPYHVPQFQYVKPKALEIPLNPNPHGNSNLDIESIVAALEAKSQSGLQPDQQPFHISLLTTSDKGRADRQFSNNDVNGPKESKYEVQKSVGFQISDPDLFNQQLMY